MTGRAVGNIVTSLVWLRGSGRFPVREVSRSPCTPSEHPFKDGTFYSNFGGVAIRYDEVPGALGMLESPRQPPADRDCAADRVGGAEGLALFRLQVHKVDLPRRRVCPN